MSRLILFHFFSSETMSPSTSLSSTVSTVLYHQVSRLISQHPPGLLFDVLYSDFPIWSRDRVLRSKSSREFPFPIGDFQTQNLSSDNIQKLPIESIDDVSPFFFFFRTLFHCPVSLPCQHPFLTIRSSKPSVPFPFSLGPLHPSPDPKPPTPCNVKSQEGTFPESMFPDYKSFHQL